MEIELQIIEHYTELRGLFWEIMLYWTSVSFGLMAASHVAAPKLHTLVIFLITLLYAAFTVWMAMASFSNNEMVRGLLADLGELEPLQTNSAQSVLEIHDFIMHSAFSTGSLALVVLGTFLGTISFLWYSHVKGRRESA